MKCVCKSTADAVTMGHIYTGIYTAPNALPDIEADGCSSFVPSRVESGILINSSDFFECANLHPKHISQVSELKLHTIPSLKLWISLGFVTSCYVIVSLSVVQAVEIFMIT